MGTHSRGWNTGSGIAFLGAEGWNHGKFGVVLDRNATTLDGNCCVSEQGGVPQVVQYSAEGLDRTEHKIRVVNLTPNQFNSESVLEIDAFIIRRHKPVSTEILGVSRPTFTLIILLSFFAFLNLLFFYVRRQNNRRVKQSQHELGLTTVDPLLFDAEEDDDHFHLETERLLRDDRDETGRDRAAPTFFRPLADPPPSYTAAVKQGANPEHDQGPPPPFQ
jgi:hypothetical protein